LEILTNTRLKEFRRCPQRHFFLYELGIDTVSRADALILGIGIHECLEIWWQTHKVGANIRDLYTTAAVAHPLSPELAAQCEAMIVGYDARYGPSSDFFVTIATEKEFCIPLRNPKSNGQSRTYMLSGKIDAIAQRVSDGALFIVEHKSSSSDISPGSEYWQRLTLDEQVSIYIYAARQIGYDVQGCVYDVLMKPPKRNLATPIGKRKYKKDGYLYAKQRAEDESIDDYTLRILNLIKDDPSKYYRRGIVSRLDSEIEEFMYSVWLQAKMMTAYRHENTHPKDSGACYMYHRQCQFFDLCCNTASVDDARFYKKDKIHGELEGENTNAIIKESKKLDVICAP